MADGTGKCRDTCKSNKSQDERNQCFRECFREKRPPSLAPKQPPLPPAVMRTHRMSLAAYIKHHLDLNPDEPMFVDNATWKQIAEAYLGCTAPCRVPEAYLKFLDELAKKVKPDAFKLGEEIAGGTYGTVSKDLDDPNNKVIKEIYVEPDSSLKSDIRAFLTEVLVMIYMGYMCNPKTRSRLKCYKIVPEISGIRIFRKLRTLQVKMEAMGQTLYNFVKTAVAIDKDLVEAEVNIVREIRKVADLIKNAQTVFNGNFIHGDLHAANVMKSRDGKYTLIDLGFACVYKESGLYLNTADPGVSLGPTAALGDKSYYPLEKISKCNNRSHDLRMLCASVCQVVSGMPFGRSRSFMMTFFPFLESMKKYFRSVKEYNGAHWHYKAIELVDSNFIPDKLQSHIDAYLNSNRLFTDISGIIGDKFRLIGVKTTAKQPTPAKPPTTHRYLTRKIARQRREQQQQLAEQYAKRAASNPQDAAQLIDFKDFEIYRSAMNIKTRTTSGRITRSKAAALAKNPQEGFVEVNVPFKGKGWVFDSQNQWVSQYKKKPHRYLKQWVMENAQELSSFTCRGEINEDYIIDHMAGTHTWAIALETKLATETKYKIQSVLLAKVQAFRRFFDDEEEQAMISELPSSATEGNPMVFYIDLLCSSNEVRTIVKKDEKGNPNPARWHGYYLLSRAEQQAKKEKCTMMALRSADAKLDDFYERFGFRKIDIPCRPEDDILYREKPHKNPNPVHRKLNKHAYQKGSKTRRYDGVWMAKCI